MNKIGRYVLCCFAVLSVSACESVEKATFDAFHPKLKHENVSHDVAPPLPVTKAPVDGPHMGVRMTGEPEFPNAAGSSSSVDVFDMEMNPNYHRGVGAPMGGMEPMPPMSPMLAPPHQQPMYQPPAYQQDMMAGYGHGIRTGDSSVEIYSIDGDVIPYAEAPSYDGAYGGAGYGQNYGQGYGQAAGQIFFKHGSSRLGSGDMRKISNLADQAKFAPVNYVTVEGFASKPTQVGSNTTQAHIINLRQSMKRSEKVSKALVRKGVPGEKIKTVSWGASKATGNNTQDRRVDIVMGER